MKIDRWDTETEYQSDLYQEGFHPTLQQMAKKIQEGFQKYSKDSQEFGLLRSLLAFYGSSPITKALSKAKTK